MSVSLRRSAGFLAGLAMTCGLVSALASLHWSRLITRGMSVRFVRPWLPAAIRTKSSRLGTSALMLAAIRGDARDGVGSRSKPAPIPTGSTTAAIGACRPRCGAAGRVDHRRGIARRGRRYRQPVGCVADAADGGDPGGAA